MRTTVTLDPDVEQLLRQEMEKSKRDFKETLNDAIRRALGGTPADEKRFVVQARPMLLRAGLDPAKLHQINDELEVDRFVAL